MIRSVPNSLHIVGKFNNGRNCSMRLFRFNELRQLTILAGAVLALASLANAQRDNNDKSSTPPGLYITPTALSHAVQQVLNPGLTNYPNFVAGEAVKSVVSPDGKMLAILTAGMNSLYDSNGNVDTAASTQFLFLYDISRGNKTSPVLKQVIQQL